MLFRSYRGEPRGFDMDELRSSVNQNLRQAELQRQMIANNAAKQASGLYGNTGTSAAAYDYLQGRAPYPVNPVPDYKSAPSGFTVQRPYEQVNAVGTPTQADLARAAQTSPSKMGARPTPPGVADPSMLNQLIGTLGPAYLMYSLADKTGIASGIGSAINNALYPTGIYDASGTLIAPNAAEYFGNAGASAGAANALSDASIPAGAGEAAGAEAGGSDVLASLGDTLSDPSTWETVASFFGFAGGGRTDGHGLAAAHSNLGDYSDGGRLLKGPGDGVSDSIPAMIGNKQPARLADGEFVVPARVVSELGNGSTEAGARKLYAMMDRIQAGRKKSIGKGKVAVNSRADKHLPA